MYQLGQDWRLMDLDGLNKITNKISAAQVGGGIDDPWTRCDLRQDNVTCVVALLKWVGGSQSGEKTRWKGSLQGLPGNDVYPQMVLFIGKMMMHQWIYCRCTVPYPSVAAFLLLVQFESHFDFFDLHGTMILVDDSKTLCRTGLSFEDVCPLDGKHVPRIAVLPGCSSCLSGRKTHCLVPLVVNIPQWPPISQDCTHHYCSISPWWFANIAFVCLCLWKPVGWAIVYSTWP
jgi:hypothetical protein